LKNFRALLIALILTSTFGISSQASGAAPAPWIDHEVATGPLLPGPDKGGDAVVNSVNCVSSSFCVAGGNYQAGLNYRAFVSVFKNNTWIDDEVAHNLNGGDTPRFAKVNSVSCASSTFCVAGGNYFDVNNHSQAFVSVFKGTSWTDREVAGALNIGPSVNAKVNSVSCASSTFCVAGGNYFDDNNHSHAFVSVYDGTDWTDRQVAPDVFISGGQASVISVSCASSTFCVAGGHFEDNSGYSYAFVSVFNGTSWTDREVAAATDNNHGLNQSGQASVISVSCASSTFCVAGGNYADGNQSDQAFVSVFNGSTWTDQEIANNRFNTGLNKEGSAQVNSVSCASSTFCVAGGYFLDGGVLQAFTSVYHGRSWTDKVLNKAAGSTFSNASSALVTSVSCSPTSFCVAGGHYQDDRGNSEAFTSVYDGRDWTNSKVANTVDSANTANSVVNDGLALVNSVSCATSSFCVAGGQFEDNSGHQAFVSVYRSTSAVSVTYDGAGGTGSVPTQTPVAQGSSFSVAANGLTRPGYNFVGWSDGNETYPPGSSYTMGPSPLTLTAVWIMPSPWTDSKISANRSSTVYGGFHVGYDGVNSLKCLSSSFCVAGGEFLDASGDSQAFVSVFKDNQWPEHEVANTAPVVNTEGDARIYTVTCSSTTFCVAGGQYSDISGHQAFVSVYDGHNWTDHEVANKPAGSVNNTGDIAGIYSVSCVSDKFCVAGGQYSDGPFQTQAFVSVYDGHNWTDHEVANKPAGSVNNTGGIAGIFSVSCVSDKFCVAGGQYSDGPFQTQAFVSVYDGTDWTDHEVANNSSISGPSTGGDAYVNAISCVSDKFCVAGGIYKDTLNHYRAFVSVWKNSVWTDREVTYDLNIGLFAAVNAISCVSSTFCVAGGQYSDGPFQTQAFVSVYDGTDWTDHEVANNSAGSVNNTGGNAGISSVSCVSSSFCAAVGGYVDDSDHGQAFTSVFKDNTWTDYGVANNSSNSGLNQGGLARLSEVSCVSSSFCVAGGQFSDQGGLSQALISVYVSSSTVSVTYSGGGGTGAVPTQSALNQGATFSVAANSLTKSGFNFAGWTDGTNTYQPGSTYTMGSSPVTLTAVWVTPPIVYSKPTAPSNVTASMNNGTATVSFTPGTSGNLPTYNQIDMLINGQSVGNVCNVTGATSCPITNLGPDAAFSFTVTAVNSKGSATSAVSNVVSYASPTTVPPTTTSTTTTTTTTMPPAKQTITCVKGKITKKVTAVSPVCPAGFKKK